MSRLSSLIDDLDVEFQRHLAGTSETRRSTLSDVLYASIPQYANMAGAQADLFTIPSLLWPFADPQHNGRTGWELTNLNSSGALALTDSGLAGSGVAEELTVDARGRDVATSLLDVWVLRMYLDGPSLTGVTFDVALTEGIWLAEDVPAGYGLTLTSGARIDVSDLIFTDLSLKVNFVVGSTARLVSLRIEGLAIPESWVRNHRQGIHLTATAMMYRRMSNYYAKRAQYDSSQRYSDMSVDFLEMAKGAVPGDGASSGSVKASRKAGTQIYDHFGETAAEKRIQLFSDAFPGMGD